MALMEGFNLAANYLMVIGGNSASPTFTALDREHSSLPLCLRRSFRPIWGPQQYSYKPPLVALPGGNNAEEIGVHLEFSVCQSISDGRPMLCESRINNGSCYAFDMVRDQWQRRGAMLFPGFVNQMNPTYY